MGHVTFGMYRECVNCKFPVRSKDKCRKSSKIEHFFAWNFHHLHEITHGKQCFLSCIFSVFFSPNNARSTSRRPSIHLERNRKGGCMPGWEAELDGVWLAGAREAAWCQFGGAAAGCRDSSQTEVNNCIATRKQRWRRWTSLQQHS